MKKQLIFLTLAVALVAPFANANAQELKYEISDKSTVLEISAEAKIKAKPDTAEISAGVETIAKTAEAAFTESSDKMKKIYAALKEAGMEDKDISTSGINLFPYRSYTPNNGEEKVVDEYKADNTISIKIKDLEKVGKIIDVLVAQGCNQMNGPNFIVEKQDALLDQARVEAIKKAQDRASIYSKNTGLEVKRIISMSENVNRLFYSSYRPMRMIKAEMASMSGGGDTPVSPEEQEVGITVNVRYEMGK